MLAGPPVARSPQRDRSRAPKENRSQATWLTIIPAWTGAVGSRFCKGPRSIRPLPNTNVTTQIRTTAFDDIADIELRPRHLQAERQELEKELKAAEDERTKNAIITIAPKSESRPADAPPAAGA